MAAWVVLGALVGLALVWTVLVRTETFTAERIFGTRSTPRPPVSATALELHEKLIVADLHADSLIWRRNLLHRSDLGHFDFPRMAEGGGAVQGFLVVTESPKVITGGGISDKSDQLTALGIVDQWPLRAILDQTERALYLGGKLHRFVGRSGGTVRLIRTAQDLAAMLAARRADPAVRGAYLGLEGADGTSYRIENLGRLFGAGFRTTELCHYTDTAFAGSSSGISGGGLTAFGREAVQELDRLGMMIDLAHASLRTVSDVLALSSRAPLVTHTGSASCHHDPKCLPDELLREIAARGGIIGLGFVPDYVGEGELDAISRVLDHMIAALGPQAVALGSGFCALAQPVPVHHLPRITEALLRSGHDEGVIAQVMGGNVIRYLSENLPGGSPAGTSDERARETQAARTVALADQAGGAAGDDRIGRKFLPCAHKAVFGDDSIVADHRAVHDGRADTDQAAVTDGAAGSVTRWVIEQSSPTMVGVVLPKWIITKSWMLVRAPILIS
ncbi:dipeptidase [Erythrobacter colymbi]|uniref:dipeptidase n=1 Tax=Erythrobacter colymbi TaxID=1161202 RepID=UPI00197FA63E|nr:membrane dipeptidase [Erythrobacter colymbi]